MCSCRRARSTCGTCNRHVNSERVRMRNNPPHVLVGVETFAADVALVAALVLVHHLVDFQVALGDETLAAERAHVTAVAFVVDHVLDQIAGAQEPFVAQLTDVRFYVFWVQIVTVPAVVYKLGHELKY